MSIHSHSIHVGCDPPVNNRETAMHQCRECKNFHAATEKRTFGLEDIAFYCPVTGENRLSRSWIACETFSFVKPSLNAWADPFVASARREKT